MYDMTTLEVQPAPLDDLYATHSAICHLENQINQRLIAWHKTNEGTGLISTDDPEYQDARVMADVLDATRLRIHAEIERVQVEQGIRNADA